MHKFHAILDHILDVRDFKNLMKDAGVWHEEEHPRDEGGQFSEVNSRKSKKEKSKSNLNSFVRYGGLSPVNQKGYKVSMPDYHKPPARRGFFSFPQQFMDLCLLDVDKLHPHRHEYVRNKKGEVLKEGHPDYEKFEGKYAGTVKKGNRENGATALIKNKSPKKFTHVGEIWSHLGDDFRPHDVIERKGSWVKTSIQSYQKALQKEIGKFKDEQRRTGYTPNYDLDNMEVFIEEPRSHFKDSEEI